MIALIAGTTIVATARCSRPAQNLTFLPPADDLQAIEIQDVVRSPQSVSRLFPIEARYTLQRGASGFVGPALFSVGSSSSRKATANVRLPFPVVAEFLQMLKGLPLREGYQPVTPTPGGSFPDIRVELRGRSAATALITRSPGRDLLPWGIEFERQTYTIESNVPAKAFTTLQPYLHREVLESLTRAVTSAP